MTAGAGGWVAVTASVRGASHERSGKPNQDAVRVVQVDGPNAGLVAAVCDGHGGDRYVRSDVGSRLGVEVACSVARRMLQTLGPQPTLAVVEAHLTGTVAPAIVDRWRERVLAEVERHPFTDEERTRAGAPLDSDPLVSYGCTLVLAVLAQSWVGLLQIGDGDATVVREAHAESPIPGDDRLIGGETTSLCLPTAVADARVVALGAPLPETLILTSDGYANSFASPTWRTDAGLDLRHHIRQMGMDEVESRLPGWLADSAIAAGDDVSMALIHRSVARKPAGSRAAAPARSEDRTRQSTAPTTARATGPGRSVAIAGLAIVVGAAFGWGLAKLAEDDAAPAATAAATTVVPATSTIAVLLTDPPTSETPAGPTTTEGSTTPSSTAPVLSLAESEQAVVFTGGSDGVVLVFDPNDLDPEVRLVGWFSSGTTASIAVSDGWELVDETLTLDGEPISPAIAAGRSFSPYVWALRDDCQTLTAYRTTDGMEVGGATIPEADVGRQPAFCEASPPTNSGASAVPASSVPDDTVPSNSEQNGGEE